MKWTHFKESVSGADGKLSFEVANGQTLYVVGVLQALGYAYLSDWPPRRPSETLGWKRLSGIHATLL